MNDITYRRQNHCVFYTRYHLVIGTKYRRKILKYGVVDYLKLKVRETTKHYPELEVLEFNADLDHIHLLLLIAPKMSVSDAVRILRSNTGRSIREKFPFLDKVYRTTDGIWSDGYFISTVGVNEAVIRKYIQMQGDEDSGRAELVLR